MSRICQTALVAFLMMLAILSPSLAQVCDDEPPPPPKDKPVT